MISVQPHNASFVRLVADADILRHVYDFFTFTVETAKFDRRVKAGKWDGKIRLFNLRSNLLPLGLVPKLRRFASTFNYEIEFEGKIPLRVVSSLPEETVTAFIDSLGLPHVPHDYQLSAIAHLLANKRGIIESPTSSGKSLIINVLTRWAVDVKGQNVLIIVPTIGLVTQMCKDFIEYGTDPDEIYTISAGQEKEGILQSIVISTWQSLIKLDAAWFTRYGAVFGDEVHCFEAKSLVKIMERCVNASIRGGFTGTLRDGEVSLLSLEGLFGPRKKFVSTAELIDRDICAALAIKTVVLEYPIDDRKLVFDKYKKLTASKPVEVASREAYAAEIALIENHVARTAYVCKLAVSLVDDGNPLVLFSHLDHGKELFLTIKGLIGERDVPVYYVDGSVKKDERELVRINAEKENAIIVAASGVFSTGINIKNLNFLVMATPTKSKIRVLQSIGRILRKSPNGRGSEVYDIVDDLEYRGRKNYALRSAEERLRLYEDEQFRFSVELVKI